jgi:hypothetical protein
MPAAAIAVTLLAVGLTILIGQHHLKYQIREQILGRDAELISTVLRAEMSAQILDPDLGLNPDQPADQLASVLEATRLSEFDNVIGIRLFDPQGKLVVAIPHFLTDDSLGREKLSKLSRLEPLVRFESAADVNSLFLPGIEHGEVAYGRSTIPLVAVEAPLHTSDDRKLIGVAQFLILGDRIAVEFASLNRRLAAQSLLVFFISGSATSLFLVLAFYKLHRNNRTLAKRTEMLLEANRELISLAKTSAMGALTLHLIDNLKGPLAGIDYFLASNHGPSTQQENSNWRDAIRKAGQMKNIVNEVVHALNETQSINQYEVEISGLLEVIALKMAPLVRTKGVEFKTQVLCDGIISNRQANMVLLILLNSLRNTLEASPRSDSLTLMAVRAEGGVVFKVLDYSGSEIALAINEQLAKHAEARLEVHRPSSSQSVLELFVPCHTSANAGSELSSAFRPAVSLLET